MYLVIVRSFSIYSTVSFISNKTNDEFQQLQQLDVMHLATMPLVI